MKHFEKTSRNSVKRVPKRGHYDEETIYGILDSAFICHVGFSVEGQPFVLPTLYGREGDTLYLHGAVTSRLIKTLQQGVPVCLTVTHVDALVLARSVFHHSANYRSVMVFGTARLLEAGDKMGALECITNHILEGRWDEARLPNAKELKATSVLALTIEEASAKIRTGGAVDEKEDYALPIWAGVIPFRKTIDPIEPDELLPAGIEVPDSVRGMKSD